MTNKHIEVEQQKYPSPVVGVDFNENPEAEFDIDDLSDDGSEKSDEIPEEGSAQLKKNHPDEEILSNETMQRFLTTRVRFAHASIRDFLVRPHAFELDSHTGAIPIRVDPRLADLHLAKICMQRMVGYRQTHLIHDYKQPDFIGYASRWWSEHLLSTASHDLTETEKAELTRVIVTLFSDEGNSGGLIQAMAENHLTTKLVYLIRDPNLATVVRDRFLTSARQEDFSEKQWQWVQASVRSSKQFFWPLAAAASKLYLTRSGPDDPGYDKRWIDVYHAWVMWTWLYLDQSTTVDIGRLFSSRFPLYDEAMYQSFTASFEQEKTKYWYTAHGYFLLGGNNYELAENTFKSALEIDSKFWDAREGLGRCAILGERYEEGTEHLNKALESLPKSLTASAQRIESMIVLTLVGQQDFQAVVDRCGARYSADPNKLEVDVLDSYIGALYALQDLDRIHQIMKDISSFPVSSGMLTFLGISASYKELGVALRKHEDAADIVQPWVENFLDPIQKLYTVIPWAAVWFGSFMYKFYPTIEIALELFERIASLEYSATLREDIRSKFEESRDEIDSKLASIYVQKARQATKDGRPGDGTKCIEKLEAIAAIADDKEGGLPTYRISMPSLVLALYLRENGAPEEKWQAIIRPTMLLGIDMLSDDDPGNDREAYDHLQQSFHAAGDVDNLIAVSIAHVLGSVYPEAVKPGDMKQTYQCDGPCTTNNIRHKYRDGTPRTESYRKLAYCLTCFDTGFCEECLEMIKSGNMPYNKCNQDHQFAEFFPVHSLSIVVPVY